MEKNSQKKQNRSFRYWLLPVLFALLIAMVPLYWLFAKPDTFLALEKRYRQEMPALTKESFLSGQWSKNLETYLADKMPLRNVLMGIYSYANYVVGCQDAMDIVRDGEGNLLEAPADLGDALALEKNLSTILSFADKTGLNTTLLIVPEAGCISPALSPRVQVLYEDDALFSSIQEQIAGRADLIDLRSALRQSSTFPFYATDHHWNAQGTYLAYEQICSAYGFAPYLPSDFSIQTYPGLFGTTYSRSGLYLTPADEIALWSPACRVEVRFDDGQSAQSIFFESHLSEADKYPVFLDGNHPLTIVENLDNPQGDTLLIVKDSYANSLTPLLIGHYGRIALVDLRYYRQEVSTLAADLGAQEVLVVYSAQNIVGDSNILWLR